MTREPASPEQAAQPGGGTDTAAFSDARLEEAIEATRQALLGAKTREMRLELQELMRRLICQRSPWQIQRMEAEKGLR